MSVFANASNPFLQKYKSSERVLGGQTPPNLIVQERETTHGPFKKTARMAQLGKEWLRKGTNWDALPYEQKEGLEQIITKISRSLEGNPRFSDHWDDVGGYSDLIKAATD